MWSHTVCYDATTAIGYKWSFLLLQQDIFKNICTCSVKHGRTKQRCKHWKVIFRKLIVSQWATSKHHLKSIWVQIEAEPFVQTLLWIQYENIYNFMAPFFSLWRLIIPNRPTGILISYTCSCLYHCLCPPFFTIRPSTVIFKHVSSHGDSLIPLIHHLLPLSLRYLHAHFCESLRIYVSNWKSNSGGAAGGEEWEGEEQTCTHSHRKQWNANLCVWKRLGQKLSVCEQQQHTAQPP